MSLQPALAAFRSSQAIPSQICDSVARKRYTAHTVNAVNHGTVLALSKSQKRHLKGLAHHLKPVVTIGQQGLRDAVLAEIDQALDVHELLKIKLGSADRQARAELISAVAERCHADIIQTIGHVAVVFRRNVKKPRIVIPSS